MRRNAARYGLAAAAALGGIVGVLLVTSVGTGAPGDTWHVSFNGEGGGLHQFDATAPDATAARDAYWSHVKNLKVTKTCCTTTTTSTTTTTQPPPPNDIVPGTGAVQAQDLASDPNGCSIWGKYTDPFLYGCDSSGASDPYITQRSGDGSPFVAVGQSAPTPNYRRYLSKAGVQSIYDRGANNGATRTQSETWSTGHPMAFGPGRYVFYLDYRLQSPSPFPYDVAPGGGIHKFSQLEQFKCFGGSSNNIPFSVNQGRNGIKQDFDTPSGSTVQTMLPSPVGPWIRLAVVVDLTNGWQETWMDTDGAGGQPLHKVVPRATVDWLGGRDACAWGLGPYHYLSLFDGSVSGQPRSDMHTDFANAQRVTYTGP